jgi:tetratricopeptide (TPR) repeat protein/predicted Ser/Thr protein kinase
MIGQTVHHYEIREQLGRGGMGVVYRAWDRRLDRWVALKFLPQHADQDPLARERFVREAKAASGLAHPHICTIHEIGETDDGQLFICMAFYDGPNLRQLLHDAETPLAKGIEIARQLCHALERAHEAGIVHRDLKPSNIMTTSQGDVAIVDFGLAKLAGEISLTKTGATMGTTAYMSPEQIRGDELDYRTDLWSLGVIIYQLLTGSFPFKGDYDQALRRAILEDDPTPPSQVEGRELPPWVDAFVGRLLAKDRAERFESAAEIERALSALSRGDATDLPTRLERPARTRRAPLSVPWRAVGVAAVIALLATLAVLGLRRGRAATPRAEIQSLAVMPYSNFTGDSGKDYVSDGVAAGLINALGEVRGLSVLSRSEAWSFRDRGWSASRLGDRLGVGALVEGSVQGRTDGMLVTTNLIDVASGAVIWSDEATGHGEELPRLTGEIAERLAGVLSIRLSERERRRLTRDPTDSFRAYELYLRGQEYLDDRYDVRDLDAAVELFRQAVRIDPEFALAHVALSESYWEISRRDGDPTALEEARQEADTAIALDAELPAALVAKARVERSEGRYDESIAALEDALARHPNPAAAHRELARSYTRIGDLEAAEAALRAATLVGSDDWSNWNALGSFLFRNGRYEEATSALEEAATRAPAEVFTPLQNLGAIELMRSHYEEAIAVLERIPTKDLTPSSASNLGTAYYYSDRPDKWERALELYELAARLNPRDDDIRRNLADLYQQIGEPDKARAQYLEAIRLADEKLATDPNDWDLRLQRGIYAAKAEDCGTALAEIESLAGNLPENGPNLVMTAFVYALCDLPDDALTALSRAIELGESPEHLRNEPELRALAADPRFVELVGD